LSWWIENVAKSGYPIKPLPFDVELFTDTSLLGYGASLNRVSIGSQWKQSELLLRGDNINCLELLAVFYAVKAFSKQLQGCNVCLRIDNMTAVTYINKMGGTHSLLYNKLTRDIYGNFASQRMLCSVHHI